MKTEFTITAEHIAKGEQSNCTKCPAALAIVEKVNGRASVGKVGIYLGESAALISMPSELFTWINDFDRGNLVQPITFTLDIPKQFLRAA